jgi:hypothetical protein
LTIQPHRAGTNPIKELAAQQAPHTRHKACWAQKKGQPLAAPFYILTAWFST